MTRPTAASQLRLLILAPRKSSYTCPSCLLRGNSRPNWPNHNKAYRTRRRNASSLASSTAVNAKKEIRPAVRDLYDRLEHLKVDAGNYVNLSRLQLALRSLETRDPVVRIAVLGLNGSANAQNLVRVLLADPLGAEASWEKILQSGNSDDGRGLLIRYGENAETISSNALLQTITVPAEILKSQRLEVLVSSISTGTATSGDQDGQSRLREAFLVPSLETPISGSGRLSHVTYPVHRTLVLGQGLESILGLGGLMGAHGPEMLSEDVLKIVVEVPAPNKQSNEDPSERITAVDVRLAASAITKFRESIDNAVEYEERWFRSGLPLLANWIARGDQSSSGEIKPIIKTLIMSMLDDTLEHIAIADSERLQFLVSSSMPEETRHSLNAALASWAENSHSELRYQLDVAFEGKTWRRLLWWKLFWRVDDVEMVTTEILQRRWLADAEKNIIWTAGRISEAVSTRESDSVIQGVPFGQGNRLATAPDRVNEDASSTPPPKLWPLQIPTARMQLASSTIQPLQSLAQSLVLQTLSTNAFACAFSALLYTSYSGTSIYEASAFAVFGLVWSFRRLQKKWETARRFWEGEIREEGRKALKQTEDMMRELIDDLGRPKTDVEGAEERRAARDAVEMARNALDETNKSSAG
ncbi:MAG: hypothetical protein M1837_006447 [Sclerophora amabilis]|nr:MAG: hypothetical protein M1837_006447 [Sclerophora amabilis]